MQSPASVALVLFAAIAVALQYFGGGPTTTRGAAGGTNTNPVLS